MRGKSVDSGKLFAQRTSREVLWTILKNRKVECGALVIESSQDATAGEIGISKGIFMTGAKLTGGGATSGYDALKKLLLVQTGTFHYYDLGRDGLGELEQDLHIRLTIAINKLPNLPENPQELAGKNTLNRVRAFDPSAVDDTNAIDQNAMEQLIEWEKKSQRTKGIVMWAAFVLVSVLAFALWYFEQQPH